MAETRSSSQRRESHMVSGMAHEVMRIMGRVKRHMRR
jgi:hypothetical protein